MSFNNLNLFAQSRYTQSALTERIKKILATTKLNIEEYIRDIEKHKKNRDPIKYYYDYDLDLDFSIDTKDPKSIESKICDDRLYYYKAYHYLKLGLFLKKETPAFKIQSCHLTKDVIYELNQLDPLDIQFILKQAVARIFEDISFDLYHSSVSANLEVILIQ